MRLTATYLRNFIFGVEDSLVSTVGLLTGIAIGGVSRETIILTGVVLIVVEAFSMAVGSFLSDEVAEESAVKSKRENRSLGGAVVMFCSYLIAGTIPLFPYLVLADNTAIRSSIVASLVALFILGLISGRLIRGRLIAHGTRMALVGGLAIAVGVAAAFLLAQYGVAG